MRYKIFNKPGFTLIESLVYIACCCILSWIFTIFIFKFHDITSRQLNYSYSWLNLYISHDRVILYLQDIINKKFKLERLEPNLLAWRDQENKLNIIYIKNNKLLLKNNNIIILGDNICNLYFEYFISNNKLLGINCTLERDNLKISRILAF